MSIEWQSISAGEERDPVSATLLSPPARSLTWLLALIFLNIFLFKFSPGTLNHTLNRGDVCRDHRSWKILPGVVILFRKKTQNICFYWIKQVPFQSQLHPFSQIKNVTNHFFFLITSLNFFFSFFVIHLGTYPFLSFAWVLTLFSECTFAFAFPQDEQVLRIGESKSCAHHWLLGTSPRSWMAWNEKTFINSWRRDFQFIFCFLQKG